MVQVSPSFSSLGDRTAEDTWKQGGATVNDRFCKYPKKTKNKQTNWGQRFISECEFFLACRCVSKAQSKVTLTGYTDLLHHLVVESGITETHQHPREA